LHMVGADTINLMPDKEGLDNETAKISPPA